MNGQRPDADALLARAAARLVGVMSAHDAPLAAGASERLRFARQTALERARRARDHARTLTWAAPVSKMAGATTGFSGPSGWPFGPPVLWWQRAAALLPLVVLVAGLVGIEHWAAQEHIAVAADIDAALLSDDLPPEAYADPGFAEFLFDEAVAAAPPAPEP
jgi:hypothetical protein